MVNVEFVGQLVDSMEDAVLKMEKALEKNNRDEVNRLRVFIFDLHSQIAKMMRRKDV